MTEEVIILSNNLSSQSTISKKSLILSKQLNSSSVVGGEMAESSTVSQEHGSDVEMINLEELEAERRLADEDKNMDLAPWQRIERNAHDWRVWARGLTGTCIADPSWHAQGRQLKGRRFGGLIPLPNDPQFASPFDALLVSTSSRLDSFSSHTCTVCLFLINSSIGICWIFSPCTHKTSLNPFVLVRYPKTTPFSYSVKKPKYVRLIINKLLILLLNNFDLFKLDNIKLKFVN